MKTQDIFSSTLPAPSLKGNENSLAIGTRLSDFEITGVLGEGGFGIVYLAFDHSLQRKVAIKEYMPGTLAGRIADGSIGVRAERHKKTFTAGLKSFINEARLLAQFDHTSLVKVYRFWEQNNTAYMAMRHYDGNTLKDIVINRPERVTEAWLKFIFKQILDGLEILYGEKILHRDVSPDNIIVQRNGDAVLLDFGSARQIIGDMTQGLTVILKPGYAPIEQYADDDSMQQGPWTDIYALAAVMYFAIVKESPPMSVGRVVNDLLVPLTKEKYPDFSEKFLMGINKGLAIQPADRPQSMDEFRRLLGIRAFVSTRNVRPGATRKTDSSASSETLVNRRKSEPGSNSLGFGQSVRVFMQKIGESITKFGYLKPALIATSLGLVIFLVFLINSSLRIGSEQPAMAVQANAGSVPVNDAAAKVLPSASAKLDPEKQEWDALQGNSSVTADALKVFLHKYPKGNFAQVANNKLAEIDKAKLESIAQEAAKVDLSPAKINVKLAIRPWGMVFVDGVQIGVSPPLKKLSLVEGKYKIKVTNPGFPDFVSEISIGKKNAGVIEHEFASK